MFPQLGSVSAALAARVVAAGASPRVWPQVPSRLSERASIGWVAGALLAAGALVFWSYQHPSPREKLTIEMLEASPTSTHALAATRPKSATEPSEAAPEASRFAATLRCHAADSLRSSRLNPKSFPKSSVPTSCPTVPNVDDSDIIAEDEATTEVAGTEAEAAEVAAPIPIPTAAEKPTAPAPIASNIPAASSPATNAPAASNAMAAYRKPPAPRIAAKPASSAPNRKASTAKAAPNCNPPFYYDNNNIRRLKLECL